MNLQIYESNIQEISNDLELKKIIDQFKKKLNNHRVDKILLINPPDGDSSMFVSDVSRRGRYNNNPPYGLGVLASICKQVGIDVRILNLNHEILKACYLSSLDFEFLEVWQEKVKKELDDFKPDLVGITCLFTMTHESFKQVVKYVSTFSFPIIVGGVHITNDTKNILQDIPEIDVAIVGEGENAFRYFLTCLNELSDSSSLGQIVFNQNGQSFKVSTEKRPTAEEFDILPATNLMKIDELSKYGCVGAYKYLKEGHVTSTVLSNKGCRGKCTFCCVSRFNGVGVRKRDIKSVVDEIEHLRDKHGVDHISWLDDDLLADRNRCIGLFDEIARRNLGITWDASNGLIASSCTEEVIQAAANSGCIGLVIGVESGNPSILKDIKKPGTVDAFRKTAKILKKFPQIYSNVFLMIGFPNETISQIRETINLAFELDLDWYKINTLQPLPNTPIYDAMIGDGMIEQSSLTKIHFDKQGGYGKVEDIESNLKNIRDTVEEIMSQNDDHIPNKKELMDIWLYMVYHLNFERLNSVNSIIKANQHRMHLNHISSRVLPNHAFALYYMGIMDSMLDVELTDDLVSRLKDQLNNSNYWRERFFAVGLNKSIHPIWAKHLNQIFT